ncbi:TPA: type II secretion system protein [bacterium]|nr:MAG: type II secretion system protein [Candidatus Hydrogenedentes bacterium CG07_land_8_20_14_0_80_42_17]HBW46397.1 type II secretion system protein [bacterium]
MLGTIVIIIIILMLIGVGIAIWFVKGSKRNIARERLFELLEQSKQRQRGQSLASFDQEQLDKSFFERVIQPVLDNFAKKMQKGKKGKKVDKIGELLIRAGNPGNLTSGQFRALQMLSAMISVTLFAFLALIGLIPLQFVMLLLVIGAGFSFVIPQFWLTKKVTTRQKAMRKSLPDLLDLLTVSVEAGLGFDQAIQKVIERMKNPLTEEFDRMLQEVKIGSVRKDALKALTARAQVPELDTLISAVIQADTLGVSIGQILRIQSDQLRTKRRQMIEEMAQKLPIKMLFPMIFFIFPTIFIVTLGPIGLKVWKSM